MSPQQAAQWAIEQASINGGQVDYNELKQEARLADPPYAKALADAIRLKMVVVKVQLNEDGSSTIYIVSPDTAEAEGITEA